MTTPILLIEGATSLSLVYRAILERAGNVVRTTSTLADGLTQFHKTKPSVIIVDGTLSGMEHDTTLRHLQRAREDTKVILTLPQTMLPHRAGGLDNAIFDILVKPFDEMRLLSSVADARTEILRQRLEKSGATAIDVPMALMGDSPAIVQLRERLDAFAASTAPVMISGEAGTGKSDCARLLHNKRNTIKDNKLHEIPCSGLTPDVLNKRLSEARAKDTVLLLDVDKLPSDTAEHLLQELKSHTQRIRAVISTVKGSIYDVLSQTGQNNELIHRLNALPLNLPSLSQRQNDLCRIADAALPELCAVEGRGPMDLSPEAQARLLRHGWPGNIPELINVLRQLLVLFPEQTVTAEMVSQVLESTIAQADAAAPALMGQTLAEIERSVIEHTIKQYDGSVPKAAKSLGVSPSTLYRKRETWDADA